MAHWRNDSEFSGECHLGIDDWMAQFGVGEMQPGDTLNKRDMVSPVASPLMAIGARGRGDGR